MKRLEHEPEDEDDEDTDRPGNFTLSAAMAVDQKNGTEVDKEKKMAAEKQRLFAC